jgi:hypothetical protein
LSIQSFVRAPDFDTRRVRRLLLYGLDGHFWTQGHGSEFVRPPRRGCL